MKTSSLFLLFLIITISVNSQKNDLDQVINYVDTFNQSIQLYDDGKFEEAIENYKKIPISDTLFVDVAPEVLLCYYQLERYQDAIDYSKELIDLGFRFNLNFYLNLGSCYDNLEQCEKSVELYDKALEFYPYSHKLNYNKGYSLMQMEKYPEALEAFKTTVLINPMYSKVHYQIGRLAMFEGKTSLAAMALNAYLFLSPNISSSNHVLSLLNDVLNSDYKKDVNSVGIDILGNEDFSEIDMLIENYVALDRKFKVKSKIKHPLVKQTYLLFQQISEMEANDGFWYKTYAPTIIDIIREGKFPTYALYMMQSSSSEDHQKKISKKISDLKDFVKWLATHLDDNHREFRLPFPKSEFKDISVYRGNAGFAVSFISHVDENEKSIGYTESYYADGNLKAHVTYNENNYYDGLKVMYNPNGKLEGMETYKNGVLNDSVIYFSEYGRRKRYYTFVNDEMHGLVIDYFNTGSRADSLIIENKMLVGKRSKFFVGGEKYSDEYYKDGKVNGPYTEFYNNGQIYEKANYVDGQLNGVDSLFYRDGSLLLVQSFLNGMKEGKYTKYYEDGSIKQTGEYSKGNKIGVFKDYNRHGKLISESEYDETGKQNGVFKEFYDDGKIFYEQDYKKGEIVGYRFYDRDGKVFQEDKRRFGTFAYAGFHDNGVRSAEGEYDTKYHQGEWKFYDRNGQLTKTCTYKDGEINGPVYNYFPNGELELLESYKDDRDHGHFIRYSQHNKKIRDGYHRSGQAVGPLTTYYPDGSVETSTYYLNNSIHGFRKSFAANGNLELMRKYEEGVLVELKYFGPDGELLEVFNLENGTGEIRLKYPKSDQVQIEYCMKNNKLYGPYKKYYPNGNPSFDGAYFSNNEVGVWKWYYINGQIETEGEWVNGKRHGKWVFYYEDGTIRKVLNYVYGDIEGKYEIYYDNGKLEMNGNYEDGFAEGAFKYYNLNGEYDHTRIYLKNKLIEIQYETKTGVKKVPIEKETSEITTYFKNGKIARTFTIDKGWIQGEYKKYYTNGKLYEEMMFENDENVGVSKEYYSNGNLKSERHYIDGDLDGVQKEYYSNGKLKSESVYKFGDKMGPYKVYDKKGKLIHEYNYYSDQLVEIIL